MDRFKHSTISPDPEDHGTAKRTIPKFASFNSNGASAKTTESRYAIDERHHESGQKPQNRTTPYRDGELGSREQHRQELRSKLWQPNRPVDGPRDPHIPITGAVKKFTDIFIVDTNGDQKNLTFGGLDHFKLPVYSRVGEGSLIGLPRSRKIHRIIRHDTEVILSFPGQGPATLHESNALRTTIFSKTRELVIKPYVARDTDIILSEDFVPLTYSKIIRQRRLDKDADTVLASSEQEEEEEDDVDDDNDGEFFKEIAERSSNPAGGHLAHLTEGTNSTSEMGNVGDVPLRGRLDFAQKVHADPTNVEAWLGLIDSQNYVIRGDDPRTRLTAAEKDSTAEIKMSMYEKALFHAQNQMDRERVLAGMMREAALVRNPASTSAKWKDLLDSYPTYLKLWMQYLEFKQTDSSSFTYDVVSQTYLDCLEVLCRSPAKIWLHSRETARYFKFQIEVALRMTLFAQDSGFTEKATAAWQAILEFQMFKPPLRKLDQVESPDAQKILVNAFEGFWDSEVPRLGESGSEGWVYSNATKSAPMGARREIVGEVLAGQDVLSTWLSRERHCSRMSRMAARTTDKIEDKDPYRVILFSDINPFLFASSPSDDWQLLLEAFLTFCRLPPYMAHPTFHFNFYGTHNSILEDKEAESPFAMPVQSYQVDQDTLFSSPGEWFSAFSGQSERFTHGPLAVGWILQTMHTLITHDFGGDEFAEYCLGFELAVSQETVRKTAKGLLRRKPTSLRLYNAFALLQYRLESFKKCEDVIITSLKLTKQAERPAMSDSILLWRTWAWGLLTTRDYVGALSRLISFSNHANSQEPIETGVNSTSAVQGALVLRAERALTAERDLSLSHNTPHLAAAAADCLVFLAYLRDPSTIVPARMAFASNLHIFSDGPSHQSTRERLHQSFARLIYHHITHTAHLKPAEIRSSFEESIAVFPQNSIFLSLFAWNEARFRIDDRVRSLIRDVLLSNRSASNDKGTTVPHLFAVYTEIARGINFGSNMNAIRAAFERAAESEACAHQAGLWRLYFLFEHSRGNMKEAKAVLYRSVRACPWVKDLYLLAFEHLRGVDDGMNDLELKGLYDLMVERELRVHVDLDELLENGE